MFHDVTRNTPSEIIDEEKDTFLFSIFSVLFLLLFSLGACRADRGNGKETATEDSKDASSPHRAERAEDDYGLTADIRGEQAYERTWVEPDVEKVASLSEGEEYMLYTPVPARIPSDGRIYIFDFGDYTVKAFTKSGEYVATYGRGQGRGPGEFTSMSHVDVWQDSLVYVVDNDLRRISFFEKDGDFVRVESSEIPFSRTVWTEDRTKYGVLASAGTPFMIVESPDRRRVISQLSSRDIHWLALQGRMHAHEERAIFVPSYFPVVLSFSADDTTGVAVPTPDYGHPRPTAEKEEFGVSAPPWRFNLKTTLSEGVLAVGHRSSNADSLLMFDLYDVQEMEYMHSLRLPITRKDNLDALRSLHAHGPDIVVSLQDATVEIFKVHPPEQSPFPE